MVPTDINCYLFETGHGGAGAVLILCCFGSTLFVRREAETLEQLNTWSYYQPETWLILMWDNIIPDV